MSHVTYQYQYSALFNLIEPVYRLGTSVLVLSREKRMERANSLKLKISPHDASEMVTSTWQDHVS